MDCDHSKEAQLHRHAGKERYPSSQWGFQRFNHISEFGGLKAENCSSLALGPAFLLQTAMEMGCFHPFSFF